MKQGIPRVSALVDRKYMILGTITRIQIMVLSPGWVISAIRTLLNMGVKEEEKKSIHTSNYDLTSQEDGSRDFHAF